MNREIVLHAIAQRAQIGRAGEVVVGLETIRGCVFKCKFCYYPKSYDQQYFLSHESVLANLRHAARRLGLDEDRVFANVDRYGNTSAGSIPICLDEAWRAGRIDAGDIVLMVGFGGGLAWGSCVMEWTKERAR